MDFSRMPYDVNRAGKKLMIEVFPELKEYAEFSNPSLDDILKVMMLVVDEGSPFLALERDDFERRLDMVFKFLGYDSGSPTFRSILEGKNKHYNAMVKRWFVLSDNLAFQNWFSKLVNFHNMTAFLRQPPDFTSERNIDMRTKVEKEIDRAHKSLVDIEKEVFPDAHTRKVVKKQVASLIQFPEEMAMDKQVI